MESILKPIIVDEEIKLTQFTLSDAKILFELTDKNREYLRKWLPWLDEIKTEADTAQKFIQNSLNGALQGKAADFGIYYKKVLVGAIGYHNIDNKNKKTTIGYWVDQDHQGIKIATRATGGLIDYAFKVIKLNRVQINCATGNKKSSAIPNKLKFQIEGISREAEWLYDRFVDWEQYSLLSSEWNKLMV